jgi:signal transduction histidine kinase
VQDGPETFPSTPRASRGVRIAVVLLGVAGIALAMQTTLSSLQWIGRVFPGFVLLDNRVIASVGLGHWTGSRVPDLYQSEVLAVDGVAIASTADAYARVEAHPPGSPVQYQLRRGGRVREVTIAAQRFGRRDWLLLHGAFLLNGTVFLGSGLIVWLLRSRAPMARAMLAWGMACGVFLLTAMDLYGPATFFRAHVIAESLLAPSLLQMGLLLTGSSRSGGWRFAAYPLALLIAALYERFLYDPDVYSRILAADMIFLGTIGIIVVGWLVAAYRRGDSLLARQRLRMATLGMLFGFALPTSVLLVSAFMGGGGAMNFAAFTPFLFALTLAYAVVKHDLFEIDAMVKRGAYYAVLTGAVGVAYVGCVVLLDVVLSAGETAQSAVFPVFFALAVLLLFDPLRTRLQTLVDRVFFRTTYDGARILAGVGRDLVSTLQPARIATIVRQTVETTIPNSRTRVFLGAPGEPLRDADGDAIVTPALRGCLPMRRVVTIYDPAESYPDPQTHEAVRAELRALDAELAVPLEHSGTLAGALTTGRKRSGLFYTAGDAEFLRALAHQAAVALANARSYEALVTLNSQLEERVHLRTVELEAANHDLAHAYSELKTTETQLVHTEKMASLGRLVAGVAHEINNPVSFIASNVTPLRRRLSQAAARAPGGAQKALREAEEITDVMARGAERTAAIVKDLRTFSRLGEATRKPADLHEGIETSLRLLNPRWRDRITVHRDFGELPLVECDPGALNQVFMNILANACDALAGKGNVWITTRASAADVSVVIRDDGPGIPPEVLPRIFDPFFTTKDVGQGTGLGLAISHGVVVAHGGSIVAESKSGAGTTFRIVLPLVSAAEAGRAAAAR